MTVLLKDTAVSVTAYLEWSSGGPATGLDHTEVTASLKKAGGSFTALPLTASTWTELGSGFYELDLSAGNVDTDGLLYISITASGVRTAVLVFNVLPASSVSPSPVPVALPTTNIYGYLYTASGAPKSGASVIVRTVNVPSVLHPEDEGIAITTEALMFTTDSSGMFSMSLLTGSSVEILIPSVDYRRVITVPSTSTNLFDIP